MFLIERFKLGKSLAPKPGEHGEGQAIKAAEATLSGRGPWVARGAQSLGKMFMAQFSWAEPRQVGIRHSECMRGRARPDAGALVNGKERRCSGRVFRSRFCGSGFASVPPRAVSGFNGDRR